MIINGSALLYKAESCLLARRFAARLPYGYNCEIVNEMWYYEAPGWSLRYGSQ
jgi:hypothetical protein